VAELVDALDLGSSDESCGGSSPSARTKRAISAFASGTSPENLMLSLGSPNTAQGLGRALITLSVSVLASRPEQKQKKI
jgi:hypothetical protein